VDQNLNQLAKMVIIMGLSIAAVGVLILLLAKTSFFRLPGDINIDSKNFKFYFPVTTCIVISLLLTVIIKIIQFFKH